MEFKHAPTQNQGRVAINNAVLNRLIIMFRCIQIPVL